MGLLDRLGLRKSSPADFSRWLEERLKTMKEQGGSAEIAGEIGARVRAPSNDSGFASLETPIDAWVERDDTGQLMDMFVDREWLDSSGANLEGAAKEGFDQVVYFLDLLGVANSTEFMRDPGWTMNRTDALAGMVTVVWPVSAEEDALRNRVSEGARLSVESVMRELFELRRWTLGFVLTLSFPHHPDVNRHIRGMVMTVVRDTWLNEVEPPADDPEWPLSVSVSYHEAIGLDKEGTAFQRLMGHYVGRRFARHLGSGGHPAIRGIGTRVFMDAFNSTLGYANAIKKAG